ncbi:cholecystokinin receptor type A, partial [Biomphalaria glabrata]
VSVATSCFTLVAISLERYFAICHPLKSRSWQTLSHSYKVIALCWVFALSLMMPLAIFHDLRRVGDSHIYMCREFWPSSDGLKVYTMVINLFLLMFPIIIMCWAYGCVSYTLWIGIKMDKQTEKEKQNKNGCANYDCHNGVSIYVNNKKLLTGSHEESDMPMNISTCSSSNSVMDAKNLKPGQRRRFEVHRIMRQSNTEKSRAAKRRVIKMLFIIVLEFFIFWTPVYVISSWMVFDVPSAQRNISNMTKSLFHLLSYVSACCNPITYCFMNKNFRQSFLMVFRCSKKRYVYAHRSQMSFSGNTTSTRAPTTQSLATSYDKIVDSDDISENSV